MTSPASRLRFPSGAAAVTVARLFNAVAGAQQPPPQSAPRATGETAADAAQLADEGSALYNVVKAGVGTVFYALGASDHSKVTSSAGYNQPNQMDPMTQKAAQDLIDSGTTKKTIGMVGWPVGGVALASDGIFLLVRASTNKEKGASAHRITFGAAPTRGGMNAALTGSF